VVNFLQLAASFLLLRLVPARLFSRPYLGLARASVSFARFLIGKENLCCGYKQAPAAAPRLAPGSGLLRMARSALSALPPSSFPLGRGPSASVSGASSSTCCTFLVPDEAARRCTSTPRLAFFLDALGSDAVRITERHGIVVLPKAGTARLVQSLLEYLRKDFGQESQDRLPRSQRS